MWLHAAGWGLLASAGLLVGVAISYFIPLSHRVISSVMGFGGGVLLSVLAFELMNKAAENSDLVSASASFVVGALVFCTMNWFLSQHGAKNRKRCGECVQQPTEAEHAGSGMALAAGALLDSIPESIVVGMSLIGGGSVGIPAVVGFFLANVPEGLSSASGMKQAGRSFGYIFGVWTGIVLLSGVSAVVGYTVFGQFPPEAAALVMAFAGGAILAMVAETMIPEAFEGAHSFIGLIATIGFLCAFALHKMSE
jgi:ZIP family zinc transporter